jgi:arylformamidase
MYGQEELGDVAAGGTVAPDVKRPKSAGQDLTGYRPVELSHTLHPGKEEYRLDVTNRYVEEFDPFYAGKRRDDAWYIMSEVVSWSHVGTHMESPFHYLKDGPDLTGIPLEQVVGECVLVNFTDKKVGEAITEAELRERGSQIAAGDIVFVRTDSGHYGTPQSHDRPYFTEAAIRWLAEEVKISCLGVDCSGIEDRTQPRQPNHEMLFRHNIPVIEHLAHLDRLTSDRFFVVAVPWRVEGLEASPVSVVAFERGQG